MNLFKKMLEFRNKSHPDHEKPFIEHLEDLRTMIFRIVVTLIVSMILCFGFNNRIMAFFRRPVDQVMLAQTKSTLPEKSPWIFTAESWEKARQVERSAANLTPEQRKVFYNSLNETNDEKYRNLAAEAEAISLYRAALTFPEGKREAFVNALDASGDTKSEVKELLKSKPNVETGVQGNLRMMSALKPTEGFMLSMKLAFVSGIVLSFPLLLMYILQFVLPGLHSHEKRVLWPAMGVGFGLFLGGSIFAYFMVLPRTLLFFYQWSGDMGISNDWRIGEYISFATQFTLLFGVAFELPVVVMVLVKLGLLGYETMAKTRSYAIVAIFIAAAVLTPTPDIPTQCIMAAPMLVLYEICIWLAWFDRRKKRRLEEEEARKRALDPWPPESESPAPANPEPETPTPTDTDPWGAPEPAPSSEPEPPHDIHTHEAGDDGWSDTIPVPEPHDPSQPPAGQPHPHTDASNDSNTPATDKPTDPPG